MADTSCFRTPQVKIVHIITDTNSMPWLPPISCGCWTSAILLQKRKWALSSQRLGLSMWLLRGTTIAKQQTTAVIGYSLPTPYLSKILQFQVFLTFLCYHHYPKQLQAEKPDSPLHVCFLMTSNYCLCIWELLWEKPQPRPTNILTLPCGFTGHLHSISWLSLLPTENKPLIIPMHLRGRLIWLG